MNFKMNCPSRKIFTKTVFYIFTIIFLAGGIFIFHQYLFHHGLKARYYSNRHFQGEPFYEENDREISVEVVREKYAEFPQRNFSVHYSGWIYIPASAFYTFTTRSDDGSDLYVDGKLVLHNYRFPPVASETVELSKGLHSFEIRYVQSGGPYDMALYWSSSGAENTDAGSPEKSGAHQSSKKAGFERELLPASVLYNYKPPLILVYFEKTFFPVYAVFYILFTATVLFLGAISAAAKQGCLFMLKKISVKTAAVILGLLISFTAAELFSRFYLYLKQDHRTYEQRLEESELHKLTTFSGPVFNLNGLVKPSENKNIVYEMKPNLFGTFRNQPLRTNSHGLRDREYSFNKAPGVFRIVGLGDSIIFGWGVKMEDTFPSLLEDWLNQADSDRKYEVINFGAPGYNTAIEAAVFEHKCLKYDPDLAILNFISNDFNLPNFIENPPKYSSLKRSYFLKLIIDAFKGLKGREEESLIGLDLRDRFEIGKLEATVPKDQKPELIGMENERKGEKQDIPDGASANVPEEFRYMIGKSGVKRALKRLAEAAQEHDVPVLIASSALPHQKKFLEKTCKELNLHYLDLSGYVQDYVDNNEIKDPRGLKVSPADSHPNEEAHRIMAEGIGRYLLERELIPLEVQGE